MRDDIQRTSRALGQPRRRTARRTAAAIVLIASYLIPGTEAFAEEPAPVLLAGAGVVNVAGDVVNIAGAGPLQAAAMRAGARLTQRAQPDAPDANRQHRNWFSRHPVIAGTLIGTAAGAALSQTDTVGGSGHDPRVTLLGTGIGAWGGLIASAMQKARAGEPVGRGTKIAIAAGAASLIVLPVLACYGAGGCGGTS